MKVNIKALKKITFMALLGLTVLLISPRSASALSGSEFNAGRIIDDSVFFRPGDMSVGDIQSFLSSKVDCDFDGSEMVGSITRAQYAANRGYPTTFTCLPQYRENIYTRENNIGRPFTNPSGSETAAELIYNVSYYHGISPKVLLVLLQKEQGLITDEWPVPRQYQIATGYGCPDTAACDTQYYGFYNQLNNASRQFKRYVNNPQNYRYKASQNNTIQWSPITSCGSSTVYIQNGATAALYNYTPYRPNQAALNNLYGTGDSCSAYGNRNFWRYFRDWFGNTYADSHQLTFFTHSGDVNVIAGSQASAYIMYKNTGNMPLYDSVSAPSLRGMANLATSNPLNRASNFASSWGPGKNRPSTSFAAVYESNGTTLASNQRIVQPGQVVKYALSFNVPVGTAAGTYQEWIQPVRDGDANWNIGGLAWLRVNVAAPSSKVSFFTHSGDVNVIAGGQGSAYIMYRNSGNMPLYDSVSTPTAGRGMLNLATSNPMNRPSTLSSSSWGPGKNRPSISFAAVYESNGTTLASNQRIVQPGQVVKFILTFTIPSSTPAGTYQEWIQPVRDGEPNWDVGGLAWLKINVR